MKKSLLIGFILAATAVVGVPLTTRAHDTNAGTTDDAVTKVRDIATRSEVETEHQTQLEDEIEARRDQIEHTIAEKRAAIAEKLSGKRAELCEKKQTAINRILDIRVSAAQRHLDRFNAIRDRLVAFVAAKQLTVENTAALEVIMNDKQAAAQAAIDATQNTDFTCGDADATAPGRIVMDQVSAQKQALKDYRTAIKNYAVAVKNAATAPSTDEEGAQ